MIFALYRALAAVGRAQSAAVILCGLGGTCRATPPPFTYVLCHSLPHYADMFLYHEVASHWQLLLY